MTDENKPEEQTEKPEFEKKLEEMKLENERMEKNINDLKELKAIDALGGQTQAGKTEEKEEEISPEQYAKDALEGKLDTGEK